MKYFIRHFVALTPSWHSPQTRRPLNPCVLQNASHKIRIIIYAVIKNLLVTMKISMILVPLQSKNTVDSFDSVDRQKVHFCKVYSFYIELFKIK
jgi:hypothetical protein